jgi:hypothetical protein
MSHHLLKSRVGPEPASARDRAPRAATPLEEGEGPMKHAPALFRVALEVAGSENASAFYSRLLGSKGRRVGGGRHYYD